MKKIFLALVAVLLSSTFSLSAWAQTTVTDAWVRATVGHQTTTGVFLRITDAQGGRLISAQSPAAAKIEIHEMSMENDHMKMRAIATLDLPAGKTVTLQPGSYHLMLIGLQRTIKAGDILPLTLVVEHQNKQRKQVSVSAEVRSLHYSPQIR